jgi:pimeloyl-ACP methyl ester carboxylesterase
MESHFVDSREGRLHARVIGSGQPVLLLHGFPDSSLGFVELAEALAGAGFRAIAPDLRGYGASHRSQSLESYRMDELLEDVMALVHWSGESSVTLVGHDWGAILAYCFASRYPERVSQLVIMNGPHPDSYARALLKPWQIWRSFYLLLFELRGFAEWLVTRRAVFGWLLRLLVARPAQLTVARELAAFRELRRPGAAAAALSYYRAAFRYPIRGLAPILVPTLVLWGERDPALDRRLLDDLPKRIDSLRIERFASAGHFVHWDEPEAVSQTLLRFLRAT